MPSSHSLIPAERIERSILLIRGHKVLLDEDLAALYGVETRILIRNVKRNFERFPEDFMFQLTPQEWDALRSQIGISKGRGGRRYPPYAFTEQGVAMLSSVLNSSRAIHVNVEIMRTFVRLRQMLASNADLARLTQMTNEEFSLLVDELLARRHELGGVECKGPGPRTNRQLLAQVVRAVLGMANRRDGGMVVIGIHDNAGTLTPGGLDDPDLATWNYDHVADSLAPYTDPSVSFELETRQFSRDGRNYIVLQVHEFQSVPILCNRDYPDVLRRGACYVRSRRKPETTEVPTHEDMRDLLELATEKRLRQFIAQAQAAGLDIRGSAQRGDRDLFEQQLKDMQWPT